MSESDVVRERIRWTGRVQGVGFRQTVADLAARLPVVGWVRNEPDGSVQCVAEGLEADLDRFMLAIDQHMGQGIETTLRRPETEMNEPLKGFRIKFGPDSRR